MPPRAVSPGPARRGAAPTASRTGAVFVSSSSAPRSPRDSSPSRPLPRRGRLGPGVRARARRLRSTSWCRRSSASSWPTPRARASRPRRSWWSRSAATGAASSTRPRDIDLMVVYDGELSPFVQRVTQELLYTLWDLGFQVGHSLRSLDDCVAMARTDFPSRTSMQEARLIEGDRRLFATVRPRAARQRLPPRLRAVPRARRWPSASSATASSAPRPTSASPTSRSRRAACATCTRPCGWARPSSAPARCASWPTRASSPPREQASADAALTFLWRVRNELHFFSGHKNDVLGARPAAARSPRTSATRTRATCSASSASCATTTCTRARIHRLSRRLIARCQETLSRRGSAERRQRQQALADGLVFFDGRLHLADRDAGALRRGSRCGS